MMKKTWQAGFMGIMLIATLGQAAAQGTLSEAKALFRQHQLTKAAAMFSDVAASAPRAEDRADALRLLARMDWWFFGKPEEARRILLTAAERGVNASDLLAELARMETHEGHFGEARAAALRALLLAQRDEQRRDARVLFAGAVVEEASRDRLASRPLPDEILLSDAGMALRQVVEEEPGLLEPSRLLLAASLLSGDGESALVGWRSYYRMVPGAEPYDPLRQPLATLEQVLPGWKGGALPAGPAAAAIRALAGSRFFKEAALVARDPTVDDSVRKECADIIAYEEFIESVQKATDEYYRQTALGTGSITVWLRQILGELLPRWLQMGLPGESPSVGDLSKLNEKDLRATLEKVSPAVDEALSRRFGTYTNFGNTAGYFDLHMGHVILDDRHTIEQYGRRAEIRLVILDAMVSNGFQSWAWCFVSQHGGWASEEAVYMIRPAFADDPLRAWRMVSDPAERSRWEERTRTDEAGDDARAAHDPYAYLPGLWDRLVLQSGDGLLAKLRQSGLEKGALRTAFLAAVEKHGRDTTIFAHEGRHVIDKRDGIKDEAELEYRAKLSEIAFSDSTKAGLLAVISPILGDPTPHGQADLRVVKGLVTWMQAHVGEIKGLDPTRPLLPQLDLLADEQVREAVRSMDPLAKMAPGGKAHG